MKLLRDLLTDDFAAGPLDITNTQAAARLSNELPCLRSRHGRQIVDVQVAMLTKAHLVIAVHRVPLRIAGCSNCNSIERMNRRTGRLRHGRTPFKRQTFDWK